MTIAEFSELNHRLKKAEQKLNQVAKEISYIRKMIDEISGVKDNDMSRDQYSHYFDGHTPYFDVMGEDDVKILK